MEVSEESEKLVEADLLEDPCEDDLQPDSTHDHPDTKLDESFFRKARRLIVIEPYFMLFTVAGYPSYSLRSQYFYYAVGLSMGIDTNNLSSGTNQTCGTEHNDTGFEDRELVQARTAQLNMYIDLAIFLPSVLSMLVYGAYSDKIGRKLLFILPPIGACIDVALQMAIIFFTLPVQVFYVAQIGSVFFGSQSLVFIAIYSYIADTVPPHKRATRMIIIDVIGRFLSGFVQLGLGYWIRESYFWPYCFIGSCYILSILYAVFLIPETRPQNPLAKFKLTDIGKAFRLYWVDDGRNRIWKLWLLTASLMVEILFLSFGVLSLFEMNAPLCWNSVMIGYYGAVSDTVSAFGGIIAVFFRRCMADHWMALLGKITYTVEMLYMSMVQTTLMMYLVPLIQIFGIVSMPVLRTMMSNLVELDEQGALFSMMHCMMSFLMLFSGTMSKKIYSSTLYWWSGFVFMLSSIGAFLASLMLIFYIYRLRKERIQLGKHSLINEDKEERCVDTEGTSSTDTA